MFNALLWSALTLAGTLEVTAPPGTTVVVDGRLQARQAGTDTVAVQLPAGTVPVRVKRLFGRTYTLDVEVPEQGTVWVSLEDEQLVARPKTSTPTSPHMVPTAQRAERAPVPPGVSTPQETPFPLPPTATPLHEGPRGWQLPIRLADGTELQATFDTGATSLGMCPRLARAAGFEQTHTTQSITPAGVQEVAAGLVPSIDLLGRRMLRVSTTVYPNLPCSTVMFGMEPLSQLEAVLRDGTLWVWIGAPRASQGSSAFQIDAYGSLTTHLQVGNRRVQVNLDTGASHVWLPSTTARTLGARDTGERMAVEDAGGVRQETVLLFPELTFAGHTVHNVKGGVRDVASEGGWVGRAALKSLDRVEWRFSQGAASLHTVR